MSQSPLELEVYYQIAMAIGTEQSLSPMLRKGLSTYMRKLGCALGSVLQLDEGRTDALFEVFSVPRNPAANPDFHAAIEDLHVTLANSGKASMLQRLPLTLKINPTLSVHVMELPRFGLLILGKSGEPLAEKTIISLSPINDKLAQACRFCLQNELVTKAKSQLDEEVKRRAAAEEHLRRAHDELEVRVKERTTALDRANQGLQQEIAERRRAEQALRESEATFRSIFENAGSGLNTISPDGRILKVNPSFCRMVGYRADELEGKMVTSITHPDSLEATTSRYQKVASGKGQDFSYEKKFLRKDGKTAWALVTNAWIYDDNKQPLHAVSLVQDISERKQAEEALRRNETRLNYLAYHDPLTDLPNRALFYDRLEHAMTTAKRSKSSLAVFFLDLDRFKNVNDSLGHHIGDQLLISMAERLRHCLRNSDTLARIGGDEFVIILEQLQHYQDATKVAQEILKNLTSPFEIADRELYMTTSIGISVYPNDGDDVELLMKAADVAMYRAKEHGRNTYEFYTSNMDGEVKAILTLENDLRRAIEQDQLELYYQPQLDLASGKIIGMEALLRWQHPEKGLIPPDTFIPLAEENGQIVPLGEWILRTACRQQVAWAQAGFDIGKMAVNISARQIRQPKFIDVVDQIVFEERAAPEEMELEITESAVMGNVEETILTLTDMKIRGFNLAIDDFGTGYSSLSYLKRFPIDALKIDKSFVRDVIIDPNDAAIATSIIALGTNMNMKIIAEGIETSDQLEFLVNAGCFHGQGYLFSRPLPAAKVTDLLAHDGFNFTV